MAQVNYVREHIAFKEYAADNSLRSAETLVWEALFHIMNQHARGNDWPDGYVRIRNERLMFYAPVSFDAFNRARKKLVELGLISYIPGLRNSEVPRYQMHYLTAEDRNQECGDEGMPPALAAAEWPDRSGDMERTAERGRDGNADSSADMPTDKNADKNADKNTAKDRHQYINYNQNETERKETYVQDDDAAAADSARVRAYTQEGGGEEQEEFAGLNQLTGAAAQSVRRFFGREATPAEAEGIAVSARLLGMDSEMIARGLEKAAQYGAKAPLAYVRQIFDKWNTEEIRTPEEADSLQFQEDDMRKRTMCSPEAWLADIRRMDGEREERRLKHVQAGRI